MREVLRRIAIVFLFVIAASLAGAAIGAAVAVAVAIKSSIDWVLFLIRLGGLDEERQ